MRDHRRASGEVSAASMSDIAFLLLIFFLVTTIFAAEVGIPLVLPGEKAPTTTLKGDNILTIQARANGAITLEGDLVNLPDVRGEVSQRLSENSKLVVVIESHPDSDYGMMVDILDELRVANARRISLKQIAVTAEYQ